MVILHNLFMLTGLLISKGMLTKVLTRN